MANRSVKIDIGANVTGLLNGIRSARSAVGGFMDDLDGSIARNRQEWQTVGTAITGFGVAVGGALTLATREAIGWESAWAGVQKTVDGSASTMAALEDGLRGMAREMPATHEEIAAVAEAAGALGVSTADVEGFTQTMVMLGETTNLTADEAATSIAQISNVMGTMDREGAQGVERFASALVHLGNNGASTEQEILQLSTRLSSTASVIGLSEADVLGYANALASVGINAEAGGTAMSRVFMDLASSVSEGGEDLEAFAEVAGMTAEQFATAFQEDPAEAVATFIQGLGDISAAGGDVFGVLDNLGMSDIRVSQALLTMAESGDFLTESLRMGAEAWEENTAVQDEYQQRLDTTGAQLDIAKNNFVDMAISLGSVFLPAISEVSGWLADLAGWFSDLPGPIQAVAGWLGAAAAAATLAGGGFMLMYPAIRNTVGAFQTIVGLFPGVTGGLRNVGNRANQAVGGVRGIGRALGGFGIGAVGVMAVATGMRALSDNIRGIDRAPQSIEDIKNALLGIEEGAGSFEAVFGEVDALGHGFDNLRDSIDNAANTSAFDDFLTLTNLDATGIEEAQAQFEGLGQVLADLPLEDAQSRFAAMWDEAGGDESIGADFLELMPAFREQLVGMATDMGLTADNATLLALATGEIGPGAEGAIDGVAELAGATLALEVGARGASDSMRELSDAEAKLVEGWTGASAGFFSFGEALSTLQGEQMAVAEEAAAATESTEDSWEDFYDGFSVNLDDWLAELEEMAAAQQEWEANMLLLSGRVSQGVIDELARLGPEGAPLVAELVDGSADQLAQMEELFGDAGGSAPAAWAQSLLDSGPVMAAATRQLGEEAAAEIAAGLASGELTIQQAIDQYDLVVDVDAYYGGAFEGLAGFVGGVAASDPVARINADPSLAENVHLGLLGGIAATPGVMTLDADDAPAQGRVDEFVVTAKGTTGTSTLDANPEPAHHSVGSWLETARLARGVSTLDANSRAARDETNSTIGWIGTQTGSVGIGAHILGASVSAAIGGIAARAANATASVGIGGIAQRATGGEVWGAGSATSDSIPALLSNGEFVVRTAAADHYGRGLLHAINNMSAPKHVPTFATGGQVGRMESARTYASTTVVQQAALPPYVTLVDEAGGILTRARVVAHDEHRAQTKHEGAWRR